MRTTETFNLFDATVRTKKCRACAWTFTSREEICDDVVIPDAIRRAKRQQPESTQ
jgi:hypothetical protein